MTAKTAIRDLAAMALGTVAFLGTMMATRDAVGGDSAAK